MNETLGWVLLALALVLVAASAVRPDVLSAWWHERFDPWLNRFRHH